MTARSARARALALALAGAMVFAPAGPGVAARGQAVDFVAGARAAMTRWQDVDAAIADGFVPQSQGQVVHYLDARRLLGPRDTPDPARPAALVFVTASGWPQLAGAMWMMASAAEPGVDFGGLATGWHEHTVCVSPTGARLVSVDAACAPDEHRDVTPPMLHVWRSGDDPFAADMHAPALGCTINRGSAA